jgi:hypothetical protein
MAEDDNVHDFTVDILRKIQADIAVFTSARRIAPAIGEIATRGNLRW